MANVLCLIFDKLSFGLVMWMYGDQVGGCVRGIGYVYNDERREIVATPTINVLGNMCTIR